MLIRNIWVEIPIIRRRQLKILVVLMTFSSVLEVVSIGLVIPFLGLLLNPLKFSELSWMKGFLQTARLSDSNDLALTFTALFCITFLLAGAIRMFTQWLNLRISFGIGAELGTVLFIRTIHQSYSAHISRNTGDVINTITVKMAYLMASINHALNLTASIIVVILIAIVLMIASPVNTLLIICVLSASYFSLNKITKKILINKSEIISTNSSRVAKILQESFGGYRDMIIDNSHKMHINEFNVANKSLWKADSTIRFIASSPRNIIEIIGFILLSIIAYSLTRSNGENLVGALPLIGALVLAIQKLLPAMQGIYSSWIGIRGSHSMISDAINLMHKASSEIKCMDSSCDNFKFNHHIYFRDVNFKYALDLPHTLMSVNLKIEKNQIIGVMGLTGSGKSTFVDLIMGLLQPTSGDIFIDNELLDEMNIRCWQNKITHVPQTIYLKDASIKENIAFNLDEDLIDMDRVIRATEQAGISSYIQSLPDKYNTSVGERGVRLSGGQRQRIGIARALYRDSNVIILDEATSALDEETENDIINSIKLLKSKHTIVIISHRRNTLRICDRVLEVNDGYIREIVK